MIAHNASTPPQYNPSQKTADQCVSDPDPSRSNAVFPAKLACITDEYHSGKIRSSIGKSSQPGADISAPQHKSLDIGRMFAAIEANDDHSTEKSHKQDDFSNHKSTPSL